MSLKVKKDTVNTISIENEAQIQINVLNIKGEIVSLLDLSSYIFGESFNKILLHECYEHARGNKRGITTAATKCRNDLSYSNRKMRQQKRTGRARVGRKGAPHHYHGAVAHGPDGSDYSYTMPKKKVATGLRVLLSYKLKTNSIMVVDNLAFDEIKTKKFNEFMSKCDFKHAVLISDEIDRNIYLSGRNIVNIDFLPAKAINILSLINKKKIILSLSAINYLNNKYGEVELNEK